MINPFPGHSVDLTVSHSFGLHTHLRASTTSRQLIKYTNVTAQLISRILFASLLLPLGRSLVLWIRCIFNTDVIILCILLPADSAFTHSPRTSRVYVSRGRSRRETENDETHTQLFITLALSFNKYLKFIASFICLSLLVARPEGAAGEGVEYQEMSTHTHSISNTYTTISSWIISHFSSLYIRVYTIPGRRNNNNNNKHFQMLRFLYFQSFDERQHLHTNYWCINNHVYSSERLGIIIIHISSLS